MLIALFLACSGSPAPEVTAPSPEPTAKGPSKTSGTRANTDMAGLEKALASGSLVLDVRTAIEWDKAHIAGAQHLPLADLSPDHALLKNHDRSQPIYTLCQSGGRSSVAADKLAEAGFQSFNVADGMGAWIAAGKPVETKK